MKKQKYERILAIDDMRDLAQAHVQCRTYSDGIRALKRLGPWDLLYLDHDLGGVRAEYGRTGYELTGYDIMCFLEANPKFLPKHIVIVSDNPPGRARMEMVLKKLGLDD